MIGRPLRDGSQWCILASKLVTSIHVKIERKKWSGAGHVIIRDNRWSIRVSIIAKEREARLMAENCML